MDENIDKTNSANVSQPLNKDEKSENSQMREKAEIAKEITELFNLERYVYIACCGIAVILLLANAIMLMQKGAIDIPGLSLLFGASGLITYSIGRLIYMWNRLVDLILSEVAERGES